MSSRVTITYTDLGTIRARPLITPKRGPWAGMTFRSDEWRELNDSGTLELAEPERSTRKDRPRRSNGRKAVA